MGADILTLASTYHEVGFNVLPVGRNKDVRVTWLHWQTERQTSADLAGMRFREIATVAIGGVAGAVSGFRVCIDIDKAPGKHALDRVLGMLDLERDYPWAVATPGKGGGWHVWITVPDLGEALAKLDLTAGKLEAPFPGADHIELRWERCQALLPGSAHPEGGTYSWVHGNGTPPSVPPAVVEVGRVLRLAPWADKGKTKRERVKNPAATVPESYLLDELEGAAERIRKAPDGRQNDTIYAATRGLGELAHYGLAY